MQSTMAIQRSRNCAIFEIESNRNEIDKKGQKKYFQQQMDKIKEYMDKHQVKVQYYKCNFKHLTEAFGFILNVDMKKDIYKYYMEIKQRMIEKAKFLDYLKAILKRRIDEDDKLQIPNKKK
jgi:hypothetical protein